MQGASQSTWQVDQAEVQRLVDALRNYVKKPETKQMQAAHRYTWIVIATAIIAGLLGGLTTYIYMLHLSSLFALIMAVCCALLIFDIVYGAYVVKYLPDNSEGMSILCVYHRVVSLLDLLTPLYAVMTLYGQDPEKIKIEDFEHGQYYGKGRYCNKYLRYYVSLPLGHSTVEVWLGHIYHDLIIIKGLGHDRKNIINTIRYYFLIKYNDVDAEESDGCWIWPDEKKAINLEMWLCKNKDKIPQWIAQGKRIKEPQLDVYYGY